MDRTINKCHLARDDVEKQQSDGVEFSREGTEKRGAKSSKFIQFTKPETLDAALQKRMLISFLEEREERGERKSGKVSGMKSSFYSQLVGMVSGRGLEVIRYSTRNCIRRGSRMHVLFRGFLEVNLDDARQLPEEYNLCV
eukprot:659017_1